MAVGLVGYHVGRCSVMLSGAAVVCARSLFGKQLRVGDDFEKQNVADVPLCTRHLCPVAEVCQAHRWKAAVRLFFLSSPD